MVTLITSVWETKMANDDIDDIQFDRHDGRRLIREAGELFLDSYYQSFLPGFEDLIKHSKNPEYYKDPVKHLGLQWAFLETLKGLEQVRSQGMKLAREEQSRPLELQAKRNRHLSKAVREIADGVAWRTLGYSRFKMRILSQGRSAGDTWGKEGQEAELKRALRGVGNGGYVLIHDATNCLRVGDLTLIRPEKRDSAYLAEVKKNELVTPKSIADKLDHGKKLDKQEKRLIQAQIALDSREFPHSEGALPVVPLSLPIADFMPSVGAIAKKATTAGAAGRMIAPYLYVEVFDLAALSKRDVAATLAALPKPEGTVIVSLTNYDSLVLAATGEARRASPPYTLFPLPVPVIAKIITGQMYLRCAIIREPLELEFKKRGWNLIIDEAAVERYDPPTDADTVRDFSSERLFPASKADHRIEFAYLAHPSGFRLSIFDQLVAMAAEFLPVQNVVALAEEIRKRATPGKPAYFYPEIMDRRRWI